MQVNIVWKWYNILFVNNISFVNNIWHFKERSTYLPRKSMLLQHTYLPISEIP